MKSLYNRITTPVISFGYRWHGFLAGALLVLMFGLGLGSMAGDSAIVDELAHIPAGYSYLHNNDYRLNPEHPPLIKDLAAVPLQFMSLRFPTDEGWWTTEINGQWEAGWNFLYHAGNNANQILFWARLPILLLAVAFGGLFYAYLMRRFGRAVALLALFFYALSPNIIAHSRFVTTDLGASVFIFGALVAFVSYMESPSRRTFAWLTLALAGAQLAKFNSVILYPFLGAVTLVAVLTWKSPRPWQARLKLYTAGVALASVLSLVVVWLFYIPPTLHMSLAVQDELISGSIRSSNLQWVANFLTTLNNYPLLKPATQYLLGVAMVFGRVAGGNVTYFNGVVADHGFRLYFPELFVVKTQVAFLVLMLSTGAVGIWRFLNPRPLELTKRLITSSKKHLLEWTLGSFAALYFLIAVAGNLNLGIRHILPIYIPIFVLVAIATVRLVRQLARTKWRVASASITALLLTWYALSTISVYPSYLSYFNELIGGANGADKYFSDSSVDWGQDLRRLKLYVENHPEIKHIAVDYFGGGLPQYYFCVRKLDASGAIVSTSDGYDCSNSVYEDWHSQNGRYAGQYIAVSETFLENDRYYSGLNGLPGYEYLREMKPIAKIGGSIYVFKLY